MSFSRPLYTSAQCSQCSIGPTGSNGVTGPTGPTGIQGPIGAPGGLNLYLNYTQPSDVSDFSLLSPLIDIDPNNVIYNVGAGSTSPIIQFLSMPIKTLTTIENGPITFFFYGSSSVTTNCYVDITGFITDDNGFNQTVLFDISGNITTVTDELTQIFGLITQGPFNVTPDLTRLGINLQFYNNSGLSSSMKVIFQTPSKYTYLATTVTIQGPTGTAGPIGPTGPTGAIGDTLWSRVAPTGIYYNGGKVGIGTAIPSTTLDVNGNGRFATDISVNTISVGRGGGNISTNTVFGVSSLQKNTTGYNNTAIGYQSLLNNTTGYNNTSVGYQSLLYTTTGANNIAIGCESLANNSGGINNIAFGYQSSINNIGSSNIAMGYQSLYSNSSSNIVALGNQSLYRNTTGVNNIAIGFVSLTNNTIGINNIGIGNESLRNNITSSNNIAFGYKSLTNNIGSSNIAIGSESLLSNTANYNIGIGEVSLQLNTTGQQNIGIGYGSLQYNTTGSSNVALGVNSGVNNISGNSNTFVGANAGLNSTTQYSNSTAIGYNSKITNSNQIVLGTTTENVFIPGRYLKIGGTYNPASGNALDVSGNGIFTGTVTAASFNPPSDYRIKENVQVLDENYIVDELTPVTYKNIKTNKQDIGLIAHELQEVFPDLVNGIKDGEELQTVNYMGLIPILIKEIKELKQRVSILENEK
jgi:hypothetical protein